MIEHEELASTDVVERIGEYTGLGEKTKTRDVLADVWSERERQDAKWGQQNHPDGTGAFKREAERARRRTEYLFAKGHPMWWPILLEEVYEALAEEDPAKLREELVQVAAVAVAWVEAIDRRTS